MSANNDPRLAMVAVELPTGGYRIGTGYLVTPRLVLTSGHVWWGDSANAPGKSAQVWLNGAPWKGAALRWTPPNHELDACLFELSDEYAVDSGLLWGNYDRSQPVEWHAAGFPVAAEIPQLPGTREFAEASGMLTAEGGGVQVLHEATVTHGPNRYEAWRGLSGAAVFADGCLVGLVCQALERFDGQRLWFTPIQRVLAACPPLANPDVAIVPSGGLRTNIEPRVNDNPAALLNARHAVVPFADAVRTGELRFLDHFCDGSQFIDLAIFTGPGGSGKTRLLAEYCRRRRSQNWRAGFLDGGENGLATLLNLLRESRTPTVVTIDYAESRPKLAEELESIIEAVKHAQSKTGGKVRIVLLARTAGDWWEYLRARDGALSDLLLGKIPFALTPISVPGAQRQPLFDRAVEVFASLRGTVQPCSNTPDLDDPLFERILYLHMAALAQVDGLRLSASELLSGICRHEQRFWREYAARQRPSDDDLAELESCAARLVTALTLRGGASSLDDATQLGATVQGPDQGFIKFLHRRLYPGRGGTDPLGAYLAPLEPDLLGEALVTDVLKRQESASEFLEQVFKGDQVVRLRNGFTVLGRIAMEHADVGVPWLRQLLDADVGQRAIPAFESAVALGDKSAFVPLGDVIADAMRREGNAALAAHFEMRMPPKTVGMRGLAAWMYEELLAAQGVETDERSGAERARCLNNLGAMLSELGQREAALEASREAVQIYRQLAGIRPNAFFPNLAISLNNLGAMLLELGQREAAIRALSEAVGMFEQLARKVPQAFGTTWAKCQQSLQLVIQAGPHTASPRPAISNDPTIHRGAPNRTPLPATTRKTTDCKIRDSLRSSARLLAEGKYDDALTVLNEHRDAMILELKNARAVCLLRAGRPEEALRTLERRVTCPDGRRIRENVPTPAIVTYLTAVLLAEGELVYCETALADIKDYEPARALEKAIEEYRSGLNWRQRILHALGAKAKNFKLTFEPGVWMDLPKSTSD